MFRVGAVGPKFWCLNQLGSASTGKSLTMTKLSEGRLVNSPDGVYRTPEVSLSTLLKEVDVDILLSVQPVLTILAFVSSLSACQP